MSNIWGLCEALPPNKQKLESHYCASAIFFFAAAALNQRGMHHFHIDLLVTPLESFEWKMHR